MVDCTELDEQAEVITRGQQAHAKAVHDSVYDVIDLASPDRAEGPPCRPGLSILDNNMAQSQQQLSSQPSIEMLDGEEVAPRASHKRLWGEMANEQQAGMRWGGTGMRSQRLLRPLDLQPSTATTAAAGSGVMQHTHISQPGSTPPQPPRQLLPSSRRRVVRPRAAQQAAAAPAVIILDDSPSQCGPAAGALSQEPEHVERQQQQHRARRGSNGFQAALAAAGIAPHSRIRSAAPPATVQSNPRLGGHQLAHRSSESPAAEVDRHAALRNRWRSSTADSGELVASSGSSGQSFGRSNSRSSSDADVARKAQEEEDARLARRLMEEEQLAAQREAAQRYRMRAELYRMQEEAERQAERAAAVEAAMAAANAAPNRRVGRAPTRVQQEDAHPARALQQPDRGSPHWGMAMAQALMQLPRFGMGGGRGRGRGHAAGFPVHLVAMREAVLGMQRAGLPPHLLFSDRDFTADDYEALCRLDETVENRKGASANTITSLPTQTVPPGGILGPSGEKLSCAVCLEEYCEGAELRSLPCLHKFHKDCIDKWLAQKACCPVCNQECK